MHQTVPHSNDLLPLDLWIRLLEEFTEFTCRLADCLKRIGDAIQVPKIEKIVACNGRGNLDDLVRVGEDIIEPLFIANEDKHVGLLAERVEGNER